MKNLVVVSLFVSLAACSDNTPSGGDGCSNTADCQAGSACVDGECKDICLDDNDCGAGQICAEDICVPGGRDEAPVIASINGDGVVDSASGHTANRIDDRVIILGENFDGASVTLVDGTTEIDLEVCEASDTRLVVTMPPTLEEGTYLLRVASQGGSCDATLPVLQGEPGTPGAAGSNGLDGTNGTCDPSACTMQIYPGATTVTGVVARAVAPSGGAAEQSLTLNGGEVVGTAVDGVWVTVLARQDHSTSGDARFGRSYDPNDITELNQLVVALGSVTASNFVIVVSRGDVSTRMNEVLSTTTSLADELVRLGASDRIRTVTADESFVLVGFADAGTGNGSFMVSDTGATELMATLVDDQVLGPRRTDDWFRLSTYALSCSPAACTLQCDPGDLLISCWPGSDASSGDMDTSANTTTQTCSKGANDPIYTLRAICLDLMR